MKEILRRLWWDYRCNRSRPSHPHVRNSWVDDLDLVDPSARIINSRLNGAVALGKRCALDGCTIRANSRVSVGAYSNLSGPVQIVADMNSVEIGKFCSIAPGVVIWESLHDHARITTHAILSEVFAENFRRDYISKGAVRIGNDVWIGTQSIVLSGVTIGDGAVIGAGSIVTRDVPPYVIAAGAPAVKLKQRFPDALALRLQALKWWDWNEEELLRNRFVFEQALSAEMLDQLARDGFA